MKKEPTQSTEEIIEILQKANPGNILPIVIEITNLSDKVLEHIPVFDNDFREKSDKLKYDGGVDVPYSEIVAYRNSLSESSHKLVVTEMISKVTVDEIIMNSPLCRYTTLNVNEPSGRKITFPSKLYGNLEENVKSLKECTNERVNFLFRSEGSPFPFFQQTNVNIASVNPGETVIIRLYVKKDETNAH